MRLTPQQTQALRGAIMEIAPEAASIRLFGSRLDDNALGGDIDLLINFNQPIEPPALLSARLAVKASRALDNRKVDIVLSTQSDAKRDSLHSFRRRQTTMMQISPQAERLLFLAKVIEREIKHLKTTDHKLFAQSFTLMTIKQMDQDEDLAERVEAFVSRFGRLQDTLGDKLLPNLLAFVGERPATVIDNLDRAERLGWIKSSDDWLETRKLRNQMVHEYIEAPEILVDAINYEHDRVEDLVYAATQMLAIIERRIIKLTQPMPMHEAFTKLNRAHYV